MSFPVEALFTVIGVTLVLLLIGCAPSLLGMLIGQIGSLIRNIFTKDDDDL